MATIVPAMPLAAHAKSSTLYGRESKFFRLDGLLLFLTIMGLGCARCELRYNITDLVLRFSFSMLFERGIMLVVMCFRSKIDDDACDKYLCDFVALIRVRLRA